MNTIIGKQQEHRQEDQQIAPRERPLRSAQHGQAEKRAAKDVVSGHAAAEEGNHIVDDEGNDNERDSPERHLNFLSRRVGALMRMPALNCFRSGGELCVR
jgi:hypothetical protein